MIEEIAYQENCEVIFLTEHWLHEHERNIIENDFKNFNIIFKSDMESSYLTKPGRPFGGKCWLLGKALKIVNFEFYNDISIVDINMKNNIRARLVGVWLPYDDRSTESFSNFENSINFLEEIIKEHRTNRAPCEQLFIMGDFNADTHRDKRFDKLLKKLIENNKLVDGASDFKQLVKYTYKKGYYKSKIDHILYGIEQKDNVSCCSIFNNPIVNFSDHNPIICETKLDISEAEENSNEVCSNNTRRFHRLNWKNEDFKTKYQTNLNKLASELEKILFENTKIDKRNERTIADIILEMIPIILLKAARNSESTANKRLINFRKIARTNKMKRSKSKSIKQENYTTNSKVSAMKNTKKPKSNGKNAKNS
jgi:hypothetical protein